MKFSTLLYTLMMLITIRITAGADQPDARFLPNTLSFKLKSKPAALLKSGPHEAYTVLGIPSVDRILQQAGASGIRRRFHTSSFRSARFGLDRIVQVSFPETEDLDLIVASLNQDPNVEYAEKIPLNFKDAVPDDPRYSEQQHLPQIMAEFAWDIHRGENGLPIVIAIIDDAVDWRHPDLAENVWQNLGEDSDHDGHVLEFDGTQWQLDAGDMNGIDDDGNGYIDDFIGWDFVNSASEEDNNPEPEMPAMSHGTHVAGLAAGVTNNGSGIAGISWNVKFMICKHDADGENPYDSDLYQGIIYAIENGADIINMSWGNSVYSQINQDILRYAWSEGVILVAAAGNDNHTLPHYPAGYSQVLSVASVSKEDKKASYSNYGLGVDISAPGGEYWVDSALLSTVPEGGYDRYQGTSMASPVTAGLLALMKSYRPAWNNTQLVTQLLGTADDIDGRNAGLNPGMMGYGRINAFRALSETNVILPQELRLDVDLLPPRDTNGNQALEQGETATLSFKIHNYTQLLGDPDMNLTLRSNDPDVQILDGEQTISIPADSSAIFADIFQIKISANASSHLASLTLSIQSDKSILGGNTIPIHLLIGAGGCLVWEPKPDDINSSGTYLYHFLKSKQLDVIYINDIPHALTGFDAVFLCFGAASETAPEFDNQLAQAIRTYLVQKGKLFFEGTPNTVLLQSQLSSLMSLMGLDGFEPGTIDYPLVSMKGTKGAVTQGMDYTGTDQADQRVPKLTPRSGAQTVLREMTRGPAAVTYIGSFFQKVWIMSYALGSLHDSDLPSSRAYLTAQMLDFFGILPSPFVMADFYTSPNSGQPASQIQFYDISFSIPEKDFSQWAWDIDDDGIVDWTGPSLQTVYPQAGYYGIRLQAGNGSGTDTRRETGAVKIFNGSSAVECNGGTSLIRIEPSETLDFSNSWTLEGWIYPTGFGEAPGYGYGRILDNSAVTVFLHNNAGIYNEQSLVLAIDGPDGTFSTVSSPMGSVALNRWSHIAVSYEMQPYSVNMAINGETLPVSAFNDPIGAVAEHSENPLFIGNREDLDRSFDGILDEIRIWRRVLSEAEIQSVMSGPTPSSADLMAGWNFDEGSGTLIHDLTGVHDGTASNFQWTANTPYEFITETGISGSIQPAHYALGLNFPNPFNPSTTIPFTLSGHSRIQLRIYDILGREVVTLIHEPRTAGEYRIQWDGLNSRKQPAAAGIYFYRLSAENNSGSWSKARKMILIR